MPIQTTAKQCRALWVSLLLLTAMWTAAACSETDDAPRGKNASASAIPLVRSEAHWQQLLDDSVDRLLVVEFYADWCDPCRRLAPILEKMAARFEGRARFFRIDIDVHRDMARRYKVRGIPFTILISKGDVVDSLFGLQPAARYRRSIEKQLEGRQG